MDDKKTNFAKQNKNEEHKDKNKESEKDQIVHLKQEIIDLENQAKRIFADYQNLERRAVAERRDLILSANKHLLLRLLPVLDTLMLAFIHTKDKGLELSVKQFTDTLELEGVKKIDVKDKKFDPHLMECVAVELGEDGKVISEVKAGYLLNDQVLRPAMVKVGRKNPPAGGEKEKLN